jgi:putative flippase GtrA
VFFGGLTTLVNFLVYYPLYNLAKWDATVSTIVAWVVAVVFAFFTNKPFVFDSHDWRAKTVAQEVSKFFSSRLVSGLLETGAIFLFVTLMELDGNIIKLVVSFAVVILNYIFSKLLVFRK